NACSSRTNAPSRREYEMNTSANAASAGGGFRRRRRLALARALARDPRHVHLDLLEDRALHRSGELAERGAVAVVPGVGARELEELPAFALQVLRAAAVAPPAVAVVEELLDGDRRRDEEADREGRPCERRGD